MAKKAATRRRSQPNLITTNRVGSVRTAQMGGEDYLVCPVVMLTEGVHNGSNGPLYYPGEELSKEPDAWNHMPIVVYHPEKDGQGISARQPEVLSERSVGIVLNSKYDGKLRAEAWLKMNRLAQVDIRVLQAVQNNQLTEVSTGVFTTNEETSGDWNGESYTAIARQLRPDHLAILPDQKGACSIADGAGLLQLNHERIDGVFDAMGLGDDDVAEAEAKFDRLHAETVARLAQNALSHENIRSALRSQLIAKINPNLTPGSDPTPYPYIEDVYDGFFVYEVSGKLYRQTYAKTANEVAISDDEPEMVIRATTYRTISGALIANAGPHQTQEPKMKKADAIARLISNGGYEETDRNMLSAMSEPKLVRMAEATMTPEEKAASQGTTDGQPATAPAKAAAAQPTPATAAGDTPAPATQNAAKPATYAEWLGMAPPEVRSFVSNAVAKAQADKAKLIEEITTNAADVGYTADELQGMDNPQLERLATLARRGTQPAADAAPPMGGWFGGAGTAPPVANAGKDDEAPLGLPTMNFDPAAS